MCPSPPERGEVERLVDHLFRHQSGRMVATLARYFGAAELELAEEVVQEALVKALQRWPTAGVPRDPEAWLIQAAKNAALDALRRRALHRRSEDAIAAEWEAGARAELEAAFAEEVTDDQLRLMFLCCHPLLAPEVRVALTLNVVAGFSAAEVARAFLLEPATAAQRLVRAKKRLRESGASLEMPAGPALAERLGAVLEALYLLFNEGYSAHGGDRPVREELCAEAVRLTRLLARHPAARSPRVHALLALMLLQAARLPARLDDAGDLLLLADQDRSLWDGGLIAAGLRELERSAAGGEITAHHLQAAIAACHATAPDFAATDWPRILALYDQLREIAPSPLVELNRAVALAMVEGPDSAVETVRALEGEPELARYALLPATLAELYRRGGDPSEAARHLRRALELPGSEAERRLLERRLREVGG